MKKLFMVLSFVLISSVAMAQEAQRPFPASDPYDGDPVRGKLCKLVESKIISNMAILNQTPLHYTSAGPLLRKIEILLGIHTGANCPANDLIPFVNSF